MASSMLECRVSLVRAYHIRKLLWQYRCQLKPVVALGAGLNAEFEGDLNAVLESLYLEPIEIALKARELEILTCRHQLLAEQLRSDARELQQIASEIFWILGFRLIASITPLNQPAWQRTGAVAAWN
jgi:hypothetical protein